MQRYKGNTRHLNKWIRIHLYGDRFYTGKLLFSAVKLRNHLQRLFKPGMNWYNWGTEWEIDQVIPIKYKNPETGKYVWDQVKLKDPNSVTFKKCHALENLQPMWKWQNVSKSNRYTGQYRYVKKEKKTIKALSSVLYSTNPETIKIINELKEILSEYEFKFLTYLQKEYTQKQIVELVNKGKSQVCRDSLKIRKKINEYLDRKKMESS